MTRLIAIALSFSAFVALPACGKGGGGSSCDDLVDHIQDISGVKIPDDAKPGALAKCEKMKPEERDCAFKASDLAGLMACRK